MQRLSLISPIHGSIDFTTDKDGDAPASAYVFNTVYGTGKPATDMYDTQGARQDGSTFHAAYLTRREIEFNGYIFGREQAAMYEAMAKLNGLLANGNEPLRIEYGNDYATWYTYGVVTGAADYEPRVELRPHGHFKPFALTITCPDPFWYLAGYAAESYLEYSPGLFAFPFELAEPGVEFGVGGYDGTIDNSGNALAPVEVWIYGPAVDPSLVNVTTGATMSFRATIAPYEALHVRTKHGEQAVEIVNITTNKAANAWGTMALGSSVTRWMLAPGANAVRFSNSDESVTSTRVKLTWPAPFSGV